MNPAFELAGPLSFTQQNPNPPEVAEIMNPFGGVVPPKSVTEVPCTYVDVRNILPSIAGPGTAVVAGAVNSGHFASEPGSQRFCSACAAEAVIKTAAITAAGKVRRAISLCPAVAPNVCPEPIKAIHGGGPQLRHT